MKNNSKKSIYRITVTIILIFLLLFVYGCGISDDRPPKMEGPAPDPHEGVFVSEHAVFTFDGANRVFVEFDEEYLDVLDNPPNNTYYSYIFTWYNFGECRYDAASVLKVFHEESDTSLEFTLRGKATAETIEIAFPAPGDENIVFVKQDQAP